MADTFTETTTKSYGSRLKDSIGGVLFGLVLFFGSFFLLFFNEDNSVKVYRAIAEMEKNVITVSADSVNTANEGKLVCTNGNAETSDSLKDTLVELSFKGISLTRETEMYQWVERSESKTTEKTGGSSETTTTYSYEKQWSSSYNDSSKFKRPEGHTNPAMKYKTKEYLAENVKLGAYKLPAELISKIGGAQAVALNVADKKKMPSKIRSYSTLEAGSLYYGTNYKPVFDSPKIGDYKLTFMLTGPKQPVTVMARQVLKTFEAYTAKSGKSFEILKDGIHTSADIINMERTANAIMTWVLRLAGLLCMFFGLQLLVNPLRTLLAILPFLANIFGAITGFVLFLLSLVLTLVTIAIAWLVVRPVLGVALILTAVVVVLALGKLKKPVAAVPAPETKA